MLNGGNSDVGYLSTGTFTQNGGTHTVFGDRLYVASHYGSTGIYKLNGGTLIARRVWGGNGTSTFNFNGGTLKAFASDNPAVSSYYFLRGLGTANVQAGGAKIDTAGFNVTVAQALLHDTTAGAPANDGGLTKSGAGTLTLTGANTYTGETTFAGGILNVGDVGALGSSGTLFFTGGSLQYSAANTTDYSGRFKVASNQPYVIDTNGQNVSFANALTSSGGTLTKRGSGTLTLAATNIYTATTTVSGGTLAISGRLANTNGIVLNNGGALRLGGSNSVTDRLNNAAPVTVNGGGTLATGGLKEGTAPTAAGGVGGTAGLGALNLLATTSGTRVIFDFANTATGSTLVFSSLTAGSSGAFVSVLNWTGTPGSDGGSPSNDRLLFQTNPGFTAAELANFQFSNDSGVDYVSGAVLINHNGYYELVPTAPQPPAITSANATTFTVGSAGTFTVTTTGAPAPTVTQTGALPNGVTFNSATRTLSGTPAAGTGGIYPITITANNGVAPTATQSFTLTVNQPPAIMSANSATFTEGIGGSFTVIATGYPPPAIHLTSGSLPSGVNYAAGMGNLSGTPTVFGTFPLTFTAGNGVGSNAVQNFSLVVNPNASAVQSGRKIEKAAGGGYRLSFIGNPGQHYTVQFTPDLLPTNWQFLSHQTAGADGAFFIIDNPPAGTTRRFYRAIFRTAPLPFGNARSFNGTNQHVTVPAGAGSAMNGPLTIEAWVYVRAHGTWSHLMSFSNGGGINNIAFV